MKHSIRYHTWTHAEIHTLMKSFRDILHLTEPQLYYPIMSLFFYIHNTPQSHKIIDFKRNHYITEIINYTPLKEYHSNINILAKTLSFNTETIVPLFGKVISLLDPIHYLLNNYNI